MKLIKRILTNAFLAPFAIIMGAGASDAAGANSNLDSTNAEPTINQGSNGDPTQNNSGNQQEKTFTQSEVNALTAKEKDQGRKAILKELGVEDVKNAKDALDRYKEYLESQNTDLQKAQDAVAEAEKGKKILEDEITKTNQKLAVLMAGCPSEKVDDVVVLAQTRMNDKTTFEQAIELVKQGYPDMFTQQQAQNKGTGSNANPQNKGMGQSANNGYGQRLAEKHKSIKENPYFNN